MPGIPASPASSSKNKHRSLFGSIVHHVLHNPAEKIAAQGVKDIGHIAVKAPAGVYETGRVLGLDSYDAIRHPTSGNPYARTQKMVYGMGKGIAQDLRHPLRHPGYTAMDILSFIPGLGAAGQLAKTGKIARAGTATRTLSAVSRTAKEERAMTAARGLKGDVPGVVGRSHKVTIPKSKNPTASGAQFISDYLLGKTGRMQQKITKELLREKQIHERMTPLKTPKSVVITGKGLEARAVRVPQKNPLIEDKFLAAIKEIRQNPKKYLNASRQHPIREFNAGIRGGRLYRPAYIPANALGQITANVMQGAFKPGVIRQGRRIQKAEGPQVQRLMGGGVSHHAAAQGDKPVTDSGVIETAMRGAGESFAKYTDAQSRSRALVKELNRQGYKTDADLIRVMKSKPGSQEGKDLVQAIRRGEDAAIKFAPNPGLGQRAKLSNSVARHIFLGSWLRASARYGKHVVGEHPVKANYLSQSGQQAPDMSEYMKKYPEFLSAFIPAGRKGKNIKALNPTAYSLFDYPGEIAKQFASGIPGVKNSDLLNLVAPLQPAPHMAAVALRQKEPFMGKTPPGKYVKGKAGIQRSSLDSLLFALSNEIQNPYTQFLPSMGKYGPVPKFQKNFVEGRFWDSNTKRQNRLMPRTKQDIFMNWLLGGSVWPTPINPEVAAKMPGAKAHRLKTKPRH